MNKTIKLEDYITPDEAGAIAGVTGRRIRQLLTNGEIDGQNINGRWLVSKQSLQQYLNKRK